MDITDQQLHPGTTGRNVATLQQKLLAVGFAIATKEQSAATFGDSTTKAVSEFQKQQGLEVTGVVDEKTASRLNEVYDKTLPDRCTVHGTVQTADGRAITAGTVTAYDQQPDGSRTQLADPVGPRRDGGYLITYSRAVVRDTGKHLADLVVIYAGPSGGPVTAGPFPAAAPDIEVDLTVPAKPVPPKPVPPKTARLVTGRLYTEAGLPAAGVTLRLYQRGFGGTAEQLAETHTDDGGGYLLSYSVDGIANIELRAVVADAETTLNATVFRAADEETLNLVVPATVARSASEYSRLSTDLTAVAGTTDLAEAKERDGQRDVTLLADGANWDARLVALAVIAQQLAGETALQPEAAYALLRAGLPSDPVALARVDTAAAASVLAGAATAGVADLPGEQLAQATAAFNAFASRTRRGVPAAPGTVSTVAELLATTGLSDQQQDLLERLAATSGNDPDALWRQVSEAGVSDEAIVELKAQGKLALLTANNAPLISALRAEIDAGGGDLAATLVKNRLYTGQAWRDRVQQLANEAKQSADSLVPQTIPGTREERLDAYTQAMARTVRQAFPTAVVAELIATGELRLGVLHDTLAPAVTAALRRADTLGFRLGGTPLSAFLQAQAEILFAGIAADQVPDVKEALATLVRLYQITPTDEATNALLAAGFTSAADVTELDAASFTRRYADSLGGSETAALVHLRAQQVTATAAHTFGSAAQLASTPPLYALNGPAADRTAARDEVIKQFPTLEALFGGLDFCECESCRSVLSPAAYFVDLLHFLDPKPLVWQGFLDDWAARHDGLRYPFASTGERDAWRAAHPGQPDPDPDTLTPYQRLIARRPDLPYLRLTCENTNVILPYVDVVNEILEYAVAHSTLDAGAVHDVGDAQSADLLAEPAFVLSDVYDHTLAEAVYPPALPFNLPLETTRAFLAAYHVPFSRLLEVLCPTDQLTAPGVGYGRVEVYAEQLQLAPVEFAVLTADDPLAAWEARFGYPDAATALAELAAPKTLAGRTDLSYAELLSVLRTRFVNPGILVLYDPSDRCDWEQTVLRHVDGTPAEALDFVRLNMFVRLWRRLGWAVSDLDLALSVFAPAVGQPPAAAELGPAMRTVLLSLAHLQKLIDRAGGSPTRWLTLWANLPTSGPGPLVGELARLLSVPARELEVLATVSGLNPFPAPPAAPITTADTDPLATGTVAFLNARDAVVASSMFADELNWTLRSAVDAAAGFQPPEADRAAQLALVLALDTELTRVRSEQADPADPLLFTDDVLRAKLSLLRPPDVTGTVLRMWAGTMTYRAVRDGVPPDQAVDPASLATEPALAVSYDPVRQRQQLTYTGVLLEEERARLVAAHPSPVLAALLADVSSQITSFFARYLQSGQLAGRPFGFLEPADLALLFAPIPPGLPPDQQQEQLRSKRARLIATLLPALRQRLTRQASVAVLAAATGSSPDLVEALLTDSTLLRDPTSDAASPLPLLDAFVRAGDQGLTVSRAADELQVDGYLTVPATGLYRFSAQSPTAGTQLDLRFDHLPQPLFSVRTAADGDEVSGETELQAGVLYRFTFGAAGAGAATAVLSVQGETVPKQPLDQLATKPVAAVDWVCRAYVLLAKSGRLLDRLGLDAPALGHVLGGTPLLLPTAPADPPTPWLVFTELADFARLRQLAGLPDAAVASALGSAASGAVDDSGVVLAPLLHRNAATITKAVQALQLAATDLSSAGAVLRVADVLVLAAAVGLAPDVLAGFATPRPDMAQVDDLRTVLRARFSPDDWRRFIQPISDLLRRRRRDALVAFLLHREGLDRVEQLYEQYLVDPGMEPVAQTSRIRLAISSVQLFVQRCLLNLELLVDPAAIDADQWQWRKRYRVWEAARKIFLFPENWLDPEWRTDKSHLCRDFEGVLTRGDVSDDLAEDALFAYLTGLEEIARLDIVATDLESRPAPADEVLHVVGRTHNQPQKYFYRRRTDDVWTPWEPVQVSPEGDCVTFALWRGRPHLFWVTFVDHPDLANDPGTAPLAHDTIERSASRPWQDLAAAHLVEAHLNWAEYVNGRWTNRTAGGFDRPLTYRGFAFDSGRSTPAWPRRIVTDDSDQLEINVGYPFDQAFLLAGRNSAVSDSGSFTARPALPYNVEDAAGAQLSGSDELTRLHESTQLGFVLIGWDRIVRSAGDFRLTPLPRPESGAGGSAARLTERAAARLTPFFYGDDAHTFLVEPTADPPSLTTWAGWIVSTPLLRKEQLAGQIERLRAQGPAQPSEAVHPRALYEIKPATDLVVSPESRVHFDQAVLDGAFDELVKER